MADARSRGQWTIKVAPCKDTADMAQDAISLLIGGGIDAIRFEKEPRSSPERHGVGYGVMGGRCLARHAQSQ